MLITQIIQEKEGEKYREISTEKAFERIINGKYCKPVQELRNFYDYIPLIEKDEINDSHNAIIEKKIPRLCFSMKANAFKNRDCEDGTNNVILLEINNLGSMKAAMYYRQEAAKMPHTLMTFVGADGHSLKIVCPYSQHESIDKDMDCQNVRMAAYKKASLAYKAHLGIDIDNREPIPERSCMISDDADAYYNDEAMTIMVTPEDCLLKSDKNERAAAYEAPQQEDRGVIPGRSVRQSQKMVYEYCLTKAFDNTNHLDAVDFPAEALHQLAKYCFESDLPIEMCICLTGYNSLIGNDMDYVRLVFNNAYQKKTKAKIPTKNIPVSALLTYKMEDMLQNTYEMRRNVVSGMVEYRERNGFDFAFVPLTKQVKNTITIKALKLGLNSWDKDLERYLESNLLRDYDPMQDYLSHLPKWDGKDRISLFAQCVPNNNPDWVKNFHTWMLSMVAQWQGKNQERGNAIIPIMIGMQGTGKSSLCSKILPPQLMEYYNDKLTFDNENSVQIALSRFALVNLDEFDSLKKSQQPLLKYLVQKSDVKIRTMYTLNFESHRRYASFIGTTNEVQPLLDETGSRRFICAKVTGAIDFDTANAIDHEQMYAQAVAELKQGARFWFNNEENEIIQAFNDQFCKKNTIAVMMELTFEKPKKEENGEYMSLDSIVKMLKMKYPNLKEDGVINRNIGHYLTQQGFDRKRDVQGMKYRIVRK